MILLDDTTQKIQAVLSGAVATNQPYYLTTYVDHTTTTVASANRNGTLNSTTDVDIVSAPGASTQRQVRYISIYNRDTAAVGLEIKIDISGTERTIWKGVLGVGESLQYTEATGFQAYDAYGNNRVTNYLIMPRPSPMPFIGRDAANLTAVKTLTSNSTFAYYLGPAPLAYSSITLRYRVTTASATITWAEVGIASSPQITIAGAASLTRLGYTDVAAIINSTGQKSTAVAVTGVVPGMHLWALFGNQATTAAIVRGALADDLQSGFFQALGATRISTMGAGTAFAVEGATVVPVWGTWQGT
jgi:hypothetical protein